MQPAIQRPGCSNLSLWYYREDSLPVECMTRGRHGENTRDENKVADWMNGLLEGRDYKELIKNLRLRFHATLASIKRSGLAIRLLRASLLRPAAIGLSHGKLDELSFQFHPLYGIPWIPSSAIKGATRAFLTRYYPEDLSKKIDQLLGTTVAASRVAITEAWPLPLVPDQRYLEANVINPHAVPFARDPDRNPPADWYDPVPIFYLNLRRGVQFELALIAERAKGSESDLDTVEGWLSQSLRWAGVGARTRKAYGRFKLERVEPEPDAPPQGD